MDKFERYSFIAAIIVLIILIVFMFHRYSVLRSNNLKYEEETLPTNLKTAEDVKGELEELKKEFTEKSNEV